MNLHVLYWFPVCFAALWVGIIFSVAQIGGWSRLAEKYRCTDSFMGSWKGWQWGQIGEVSYKQSLWLGIAADGLYLKTGPWLFFRAFHPPLCIPWSQIRSIEAREFWWIPVLEIRLYDPDVRIRLRRDALDDAQRFLGDKLPRIIDRRK